MKNIRFGIIGTGSITKRFIKGAMHVQGVRVCAVLSRDMKKAQRYASEYEGMSAYVDVEAFFACIDAVYIATPNATHKEFIEQALQHQKHVLCEKPMLLCAEDVHTCFALAKQKNCVLMEAMKPCFLPTTKQTQTWIKDGLIGTLRYIHASYCSDGVEAFLQGWHADDTKGGGALYDIGVYPLAFANCIDTSNILNISAQARYLPSGVDAMSVLQLQYESGTIAHILCAVDMEMENKAILYGDKGRIEIKDFWKSECATLYNGDKIEVFEEPHDKSEFRYQIASFVETIHDKQCQNSVMNEMMSARNAYIIDQVRRMKE